MKLSVTVATFLIFNVVVNAQLPKAKSGSIRRIDSFVSKYVTPRNVDVWLPDGYTPKKKYAVLYMQDGQALFDSAVAEDKLEWGVDETFGVCANVKIGIKPNNKNIFLTIRYVK